MHSPAHAERFHALDATRAFALLLGVVFHAVWSFVPGPMGAPIVDGSASPALGWFFFTAHSFRMQLFFLIAGFFAHLVYHRRGAAAFVRNRLMRIGVPLVAGWVVLYPLVIAAWMVGANESGRNLAPVPLPFLFAVLYLHGLAVLPKTLGGFFSLLHLWFLYYLLWIYLVVLGGRWLLMKWGGGSRLRSWSDRGMECAIASPWSLGVLTLATGLFLWPMAGWFGVDTPVQEWVPSIPVVVFYGGFFLFGWLLHRQASRLGALARHWRWQLGLGLVVSVPVFAVHQTVAAKGLTGSILAHYPLLEAGQIVDWPAFLARLKAAGGEESVPRELQNLWGHFPPAGQERIRALTDQASFDERGGVADAIGKLLVQPGMFGPEPIPQGYLPPAEVARGALRENRLKLEALFGASLAGEPTKRGEYWPMKLAYSIGYALVTWLLVFGSLGFFQALFPGHSAAWRYVADSSYWIYLVHLPLVAALQIWMAHWPWPAFLKLALLLGTSFVLLFASYHYLVRSTILGRTLNGQTHPFVAWPFGRRAAVGRVGGEGAGEPSSGSSAPGGRGRASR